MTTRPKPSLHISLPEPDFDLDHYTDDEEIEYGLNLGAESPCSTASEELPWALNSVAGDAKLSIAPPPNSSRACDCGKCSEKVVKTDCCDLKFCLTDITKRLRQSGRCPSCDTTIDELPSSTTSSDFAHAFTSEAEYSSFQEDLAALKSAHFGDGAPSRILGRALGTLALMVFLYALTFQTTRSTLPPK